MFCRGRAFTLIELVLVFGLIALLAALLLPAMKTARSSARIAQCQSNLRQVGMAIYCYCQHSGGCIPAMTDSPTNQVWNDAAGVPDSLGVLVTQGYLASPGALFCPLDLTNSAYLYRQECVGTGTFHIESLGRNPEGELMRALALDVSCLPYAEPAHAGNSANILFQDGSVKTADNVGNLYSIMDMSYYPPNAQGLPPVVAEIQKVFVNADAAYGK